MSNDHNTTYFSPNYNKYISKILQTLAVNLGPRKNVSNWAPAVPKAGPEYTIVGWFLLTYYIAHIVIWIHTLLTAFALLLSTIAVSVCANE